MTVEAYKKRVIELEKKNVRCAHLDFRGQEPIEYLKVEVFEAEITRDAFHWQYEKLVDWTRNFILDIGGLCGIEAQPFTSEKQGKYSYLSKSNLYRLLPSGNKEHGSAEYEFDAEIRAEEAIVKDEVKHMNNPESVKYKNNALKKLAVLELAKHGRQKADSGAHKRGIIKLLKIPKPESKLIGVVMFCFRCIPDMSNAEVRQGFLNDQNPGNAIFGRIEHKQDDIVQPAEPAGQPDNSNTFELEMTISSERETLKDSPAIYKLAGIILEKKIELEKFRDYIFGYNKLEKPEQIKTLIDWISKVESVNEEVINGDETVKKYFLQAWGSK